MLKLKDIFKFAIGYFLRSFTKKLIASFRISFASFSSAISFISCFSRSVNGSEDTFCFSFRIVFLFFRKSTNVLQTTPNYSAAFFTPISSDNKIACSLNSFVYCVIIHLLYRCFGHCTFMITVHNVKLLSVYTEKNPKLKVVKENIKKIGKNFSANYKEVGKSILDAMKKKKLQFVNRKHYSV